ncbi:MAG: leucine-rich repeat protein [Clostridia bacterium]|nr:leucine-rich repeat protein [Clostridia bacterium]
METGKKIVSVFLALMMILPTLCAAGVVSSAAEPVVTASGECGAQGGNLTWTLTDKGTLTVSGVGEMARYISNERPYKLSSIRSVVIQSGVTTVGDGAFTGCKKLTSVSIADTVRSIGDKAFSGCSVLRRIWIPDSVETVGVEAFKNCPKLQTAHIGAGLIELGASAFHACAALAAIEVSDGNPCYASVNGVLFDKAKTVLLQYPAAKTDPEYTVPGTVRSIEEFAFTGCGNLQNVVFPDGLEKIGNSAFSNCSALACITLPGSLRSIDAYAFKDCGALSDISLPDGLEEIGYRVFEGTAYQTDAANWEDGVLYLGRHLIAADSASISGALTVKPGTLTIASSAFSGESMWPELCGLTEVTLPEGLKHICVSAFSGCSLREITIPDGVKTIGIQAFSNCPMLEDIALPAGLDRIGYMAFSGTAYVNDPANTSDGLVYCGNYVLLYALSGAEGEVPALCSIREGTELIADRAFTFCPGIKTLALPKSLRSVGSALSGVPLEPGCTGLESIIVDGENAYFLSEEGVLFSRDKTELITYPAAKTDASYTVPAEVVRIDMTAFSGAEHLTELTVSEGVREIGMAAFYDCAALRTVSLPGSLETIGNNALTGCELLEDVYYNGGAGEWAALTRGVRVRGYMNTEVAYHFAYIAKGECGAEGDNLTWTLTDDGTLTVSGAGNMADYDEFDSPWRGLNVKTAIIGEGVSSVGEFAFAYCASLEEVSLPDTLTKLGYGAFLKTGLTSATVPGSVRVLDGGTFAECASLTDAVIEEGVERIIWSEVFAGCTSLRTVFLPASLTEGIDSEMFTLYGGAGCSALLHINVAQGNPRYENDEVGALYDKQDHSLLQYPSGRTDAEYSVRQGTTTLWRNAVGSANLKCVYIPASVTKIYEGAFRGCSSLTDVYYGGTRKQLKAIEYLKGYWDEDDDDIYPTSYENVGYQARFFNNAAIHCSAEIPQYLAGGACGYNGDPVYWTLTTDGTLTITGTGVADRPITPYLEEEPYYDAAGDPFTGNEILSPGAMTAFGQKYYIAKLLGYENAAALNDALSSGALTPTEYFAAKYALHDPVRRIVVGEGITELRRDSLRYGAKVESVSLPSTLKVIGDYAFMWCGVRSIVIPENVTYLGSAVFLGSRVGSVTIESKALTASQELWEGAFRLRQIDFTDDALDISGLPLPFASQTCAYFGGGYGHFLEGLTVASRLGSYAGMLCRLADKEQDVASLMTEYAMTEAEALSVYEEWFKYGIYWELNDFELDFDTPLNEITEYLHDYVYNAIGVDVRDSSDLVDENGRLLSGVRDAFEAAYGVDIDDANLFVNYGLYSSYPISETLEKKEQGRVPWSWITIRANCGSTPHAVCVAAELPFESLAHSFGSWTVTKEPTATEEGEKTRACRFCGETQTETIEADGTVEPEEQKPSGIRKIIQFFLNLVNFFRRLFSKK